MNAQERDQLNQLLKQLVEVRLAAKDPEAESLIREAATQQPDATYLLVQRTLLLDQALINAKTRIDDLQNQLQRSQTAQSNSFLSNDPWAQPAAAGSGPVPGVGSYQIPRNAQQPQQQQQQQQAPVAASPFGGGGSSFLGNVATTAAGVVAGSFLFQGIENLMGGGHHASGFGQQALNDHNVPDQTVINNYYGDDAKQLADNNDSHESYADNSDSNDFFASNDDDSFVDDDTDDSSWA
ncbi:MAG: DUF2076 domain-containing protein [Methylococcales bacterium]